MEDLSRPGIFAEDKSLALYLKEISRHRPLSMAEEADLVVEIRKGDKLALEKLVNANLRFVVSVARNYQHKGAPLCDLINEGNLGLISAAKRFDETKKFKFISYAVWWIRQAVLQYLAEQSRIIKLPLNRVGTLYRIGRVTNKLEQKYRRLPDAREIAKELRVDEKEISETLKIQNNHTSLDTPFSSDKDGKMLDMLQDHNQVSPDAFMQDSSVHAEIEKTLETLSPREAKVIKLYYGIGMDNSHTLQEIGLKYNLTRERVRQIKEKAIHRLKHCSRSNQLLAFKA